MNRQEELEMIERGNHKEIMTYLKENKIDEEVWSTLLKRGDEEEIETASIYDD